MQLPSTINLIYLGFWCSNLSSMIEKTRVQVLLFLVVLLLLSLTGLCIQEGANGGYYVLGLSNSVLYLGKYFNLWDVPFCTHATGYFYAQSGCISLPALVSSRGYFEALFLVFFGIELYS